VKPGEELPELDLPPGTRVIADLHLDLGRADGGAAFLGWLERAGEMRALVVLGDFFDVWIGPGQERMPGAAPVLDALRRLAGRGTQVEVVHGNRDFLLGRSFEQRTGARIHARGFVGRFDRASLGLPARRAVLIHGDELCTRDKAYQRLKLVVRSAPIAGLAPHLPLPLATFLARALRRTSVRAVERKASETKVVQEAACRAYAETFRADTVVCGHVHQFRDLRLPGGPRWIVLDAFGGERDVVEFGADGELRATGSRATPAVLAPGA